MKIVFEGEFCTLNEYINKERGNKYAGHAIKKEETNRAAWEAKVQIEGKIPEPANYHFTWYRKNRRTDPGNIAFSEKFIMDALVKIGAISNDGWRQVNSYTHDFFVDKENPRVVLEITPASA